VIPVLQDRKVMQVLPALKEYKEIPVLQDRKVMQVLQALKEYKVTRE